MFSAIQDAIAHGNHDLEFLGGLDSPERIFESFTPTAGYWAKAHQVPVGPGRGSGAGSLVAFALGITDLDPIPYALLFERFLNPERVSMPDFDIDFCQDKRSLVIDYVRKRYGSDAVSQIATFGTMASKAVIRMPFVWEYSSMARFQVRTARGWPFNISGGLAVSCVVGMTDVSATARAFF